MNLKNEKNIIFEILKGTEKLAVLKAAVEMNMADILEKESEPEKIGKELGIKTDTANLCHFLDSLTASGLCIKKDQRYFNNENSLKYLLKKSPYYMGELIFNMDAMRHRNLNRITELVKNGPPPVEKKDKLQSEEKWQNSMKHLASYQRAWMTEFAGNIISSLPQFAKATKILDLGCGPGLMCMEILKRKPDLKGVLFDLPKIIEFAAKEAEKEGVADRMELLRGDYNETGIGNYYDIIWASHNLYYVKEPVTFFKKVLDSLNNDGVFICLHEGLENEKTCPEEVVLSRLSLALEGQDVSFEKGEIASNLLKAGFGYVQSRQVLIPSGECELVTAGKKFV